MTDGIPVIGNLLDELNIQWKLAEEEMTGFHLSLPIEIPVDLNDGRSALLSWRQVPKEGRWRICVKAEDEWKPIAECVKELRISLAVHYGALKSKAIETRERLPREIMTAIDALKAAMGPSHYRQPGR